jgi:hypothetical protein
MPSRSSKNVSTIEGRSRIVFSESLDKMRNEDDPPEIKKYVENIKRYYEEEKSGHGLQLT